MASVSIQTRHPPYSARNDMQRQLVNEIDSIDVNSNCNECVKVCAMRHSLTPAQRVIQQQLEQRQHFCRMLVVEQRDEPLLPDGHLEEESAVVT